MCITNENTVFYHCLCYLQHKTLEIIHIETHLVLIYLFFYLIVQVRVDGSFSKIKAPICSFH